MKKISLFALTGAAILFLSGHAQSILCEAQCEYLREGCISSECPYIGKRRASCIKEKCSEFGAFEYKKCMDECRGYEKQL